MLQHDCSSDAPNHRADHCRTAAPSEPKATSSANEPDGLSETDRNNGAGEEARDDDREEVERWEAAVEVYKAHCQYADNDDEDLHGESYSKESRIDDSESLEHATCSTSTESCMSRSIGQTYPQCITQDVRLEPHSKEGGMRRLKDLPKPPLPEERPGEECRSDVPESETPQGENLQVGETIH